MNILGISCYYHDSAVTLVQNGKITFALQEERFTRLKHDKRFPINAIKNILKISNLEKKDLDLIVYHESPELKFQRYIDNFSYHFKAGFKNFINSSINLIGNRLNIRKKIEEEFPSVKNIIFSQHHLSHAASAFYPSPFKDALILTIDGVGELNTTGIFIGNDNKIEPLKEIHYPHSLGLLYSSFTNYLGFKVNSGEYKVMGLAPYGEPVYAQKIKENLIEIYDDGSFKLKLEYFDFMINDQMINARFEKFFGKPARKEEGLIEKFHCDIASSIQKITEEILINITKYSFKITGLKNLCLAGGVALNCVANGKIYKENIFKNIWIQPASGDAGCSLGAALIGASIHNELDRNHVNKKEDSMSGSYLGNSYKNDEISNILENLGAKYTQIKDDEKLTELISTCIEKNNVIGLFQGAMEFGPRSLGNRSIIGNPLSENMQSRMNLKIKYRESFRPFATSILEEDLDNYFEFNKPSPYMLYVAPLKNHLRSEFQNDIKSDIYDKMKIKRSKISAVTHVDFSSRLQSVNEKYNPRFYRLLKAFKKLTGHGVLINTSFNVRGEPIVCTPEDAFRCFMGTDMDILVVENMLLFKKDQSSELIIDYKNKYKLD